MSKGSWPIIASSKSGGIMTLSVARELMVRDTPCPSAPRMSSTLSWSWMFKLAMGVKGSCPSSWSAFYSSESSSTLVLTILNSPLSFRPSKNLPTYLTEYSGKNSSAPADTFETAGVRPHASYLLTMMASTPMNIADRKIDPKFCGSVMPSRKR